MIEQGIIMDDKNPAEGLIPGDQNQSPEKGRTTLVRESERKRSSLSSVETSVIPRKRIVTSSQRGTKIDDEIQSLELYNSFNYSVLPNDQKHLGYSIGVTSANRGEGKTTAACNFALSLSVGSRRRTVLVDMNLQRPRLHDIFGIPLGPGIVDALVGDEVFVTPSSVENLFILPAGKAIGKKVSLAHLSAFKDIVESLLNEYEIIIVDLPSLDVKDFPTVFCNQLNGLLVVTEIGKTKRRDVERVFRKVHSNQILGFIMNKVEDRRL